MSEALEREGCSVIHATADADNLIVKTTLDLSENVTTMVICEDTDILVLLCYHTHSGLKPVYMRSDKANVTHNHTWYIQVLKERLGPETCRLLLFCYALNGTDCTSCLFSIGKGVPLKKFEDDIFKTQAYIFSNSGESRESIIKAGEKAIVCLYNGQSDDSLDHLRFVRWTQKTTSCTSQVKVESLLPTSHAAIYHSLRVYFQVQVSFLLILFSITNNKKKVFCVFSCTTMVIQK